ncbi:MAG: DUF3352 domain-containing protein [Cyanobacteriota bacterium]|nr:DUF3352 domain-containing protein [Cyanobacteriota bacterium]
MGLRSSSKFLAIALVMVLAIAIGIFWSKNYRSTAFVPTATTPSQSAAVFVPKRAPLMVSLFVNPDRLQSLGQNIGLPSGKLRYRLKNIQKDLLSNSAIDYKRDIQPWAGEEVTLAVTTPDIDRDSSNGEQMGMLIAVATKDPQLSKEFLQLFWQKQAVAGVNLALETDRGVKLIYTKASFLNPPGLFQPVATALVGDKYVLFANHPKVLREGINNVQAPNLNLKSASNFQKAFSGMRENPVASIFVDFSQWALQIRDWDAIVANKPKLALALSVNSGELVAETAWLTEGGDLSPLSPALSEPVGALEYIPAASSLVAASRDLRALWGGVSAAVADNWLLSSVVKPPLTELEEEWGIDLAEDIFSWVKEEYALAWLPGGSNRLVPDWIFAAERSPETEEAIARLDASANAAGYSIGSFSAGDRTVSAWTKLTATSLEDKKQKDKNPPAIQAEAKALHATVGKYEIFASSLEAIDKALNLSEGDSLLAKKDFQKITALLPPENNGYFYLDWSANRQFLEKKLGWLKVAELWSPLLFDSDKTLTFTTTGGEVGIRRAKAVLTFD